MGDFPKSGHILASASLFGTVQVAAYVAATVSFKLQLLLILLYF